MIFKGDNTNLKNTHKTLYNICTTLEQNTINYDITPLKKIKENFNLKIDEFYSEDSG
mgnify:CR=1 FL=1